MNFSVLVFVTSKPKLIKNMAGPIQAGHAKGALILGIIEVVCGLLIIILSAVLAGKASVSASMSPYWAGIVVSTRRRIRSVLEETRSLLFAIKMRCIMILPPVQTFMSTLYRESNIKVRFPSNFNSILTNLIVVAKASLRFWKLVALFEDC